MTPAQTRLLRFAESQWRKARKDAGRTATDADRHALYAKALGRDKSSKHFTNADLTKVLAALRAVYDPANFDAQMQAQNDPERRVEDLRNRTWDAICVIVQQPRGYNTLFDQRRVYLEGMSQRMFGAYFDKLTELQLGKLMGSAEAQARRIEAKARAAADAATEAADSNPF